MSATHGAWRAAALTVLVVWTLAPRLWLAQGEPTQRRYWDERYALRNVVYLMTEGPTRVDNGFYPSLSFLPHLPLLVGSEWLAERFGAESLRVVRRGGGPRMRREGAADGLDFTPWGYRTARRVNVLIGLVSVLLCWTIARRWVGEPWAWVAAFLLSSMPWHIRISATFKPDVVLLAVVLLALYLARRAMDRLSASSFAIAGGAVGLAMSAKYNALATAVPFAIAAAIAPGTDARRFAKRAAIGASAALAVFVLLNPWIVSQWSLYVRDFNKTLRQYEGRGTSEGATHWTVLASALPWMANPAFHGPTVAVLALVGLVLIVVSLARDRRHSPHFPEGLLVVGFAVGYVVLYAAATPDVSSAHNWLMVTPATVVGAVVAARWLLRNAEPIPATVATAVTLAALVALPAAAFTYDRVVPHVMLLAMERIRTEGWQGPVGRVVASDVALPRSASTTRFATLVERDDLGELGSGRLRLTDAEVYLRHGPSRDTAEARSREVAPEQVLDFEPRLFRSRGEAVRLLLHPLRRAAPRRQLVLEKAGPRTFTATLTDVPRVASSISLEVVLPIGTAATATIGETRRRLLLSQQMGGVARYGIERARLRRDTRTVEIAFDSAPPDALVVDLVYWRRAGSLRGDP